MSPRVLSCQKMMGQCGGRQNLRAKCLRAVWVLYHLVNIMVTIQRKFVNIYVSLEFLCFNSNQNKLGKYPRIDITPQNICGAGAILVTLEPHIFIIVYMGSHATVSNSCILRIASFFSEYRSITPGQIDHRKAYEDDDWGALRKTDGYIIVSSLQNIGRFTRTHNYVCVFECTSRS